jgi:predicted peptidase
MAMRLALAIFALLEFCSASAAQDPKVVELYEARTRTMSLPKGKKLTMPYRLLRPAQIEEKKRYPLVLYLHGAGERGADNQKQLANLPTWLASDENREKYPCFVLAPQCPDDMLWASHGSKVDPLVKLDKPSDTMQAVVAILDDVVKRNPVDRARIYLTGISLGGKGAWELAERQPERFAAVAPICNGGDELYAKRLVGLPIWAWHGDADTVIPVERSRGMIAAIEKAGGKPKYTELVGVDHDSWTAAYTGPDNLLPWMFEQVKARGKSH